jgi:PIN domain nuclease of toxin-antitoxin system
LKLLLDTHAVLWWSLNDPRLPGAARSAIADPDNQPYMSLCSVWEIAIKFGLGKLPEAENFVADLREERAVPEFAQLPLTARHAVLAGTMDIGHKDPFDRLLIAQATIEGLTLVSNERLFDRFGVSRLWD